MSVAMLSCLGAAVLSGCVVMATLGPWRLQCCPVLTLVGWWAGGLCAVLLCVHRVRQSAVLLLWMVQPSASQTLRCFPVTQGSCEDSGSDPGDLVHSGRACISHKLPVGPVLLGCGLYSEKHYPTEPSAGLWVFYFCTV